MFRRLLLLSLVAGAAFGATAPNFLSRKDITTAEFQFLVLADVNNDGIADIVATSAGYLAVYLGDGKGNFTRTLNQSDGVQFLSSIVAVDINNDGKVDIVGLGLESDPSTSGVVVMLGNGDGTFQSGTFHIQINASVGAFGVGDFNGDGNLDVVEAASTGLFFLAGNGTGALATPVYLTSLKYGVSGLTTADFNGDGKLDVVLSFGYEPGHGFAVYYGNGNGTFEPPVPFSQPQRAGTLAAGPLQKGGPPAIVVQDADSSYEWVYAGDGKGHFAAPTQSYLPGGYGIALGDMDNDGYTDLVSSVGYVAYGTGRANFPTTLYYPVLEAGDGYSAVVGDLLNNGRLDIVTVSSSGLSVVLNQGKRRFLEGNWTPVTGGSTCGAVGDFNRDGKQDLAVINAAGITILLGSGSFQHPYATGVSIPLANAGCPVVGDANGDGVSDLLIPTPSAVFTFLGKGDGTFTQARVTATATEGFLVLADFNRDGKLDFATSGNQLAYGNGDGTFQPPFAFVANPPPSGFSNIAVGDINNDGWPDLALSNSIDYNVDVYSMLNNHQGGFTFVDSGTGQEMVQAILADLNGDGFLDLVTTPLEGSGSFVNFGNGTGKFTFQTALSGPLFITGLDAVADFNGDGIPDIAVLGGDSVSIHPGLGGGQFGDAVSFGSGPAPSWMVVPHLLRPVSSGFADLAFPDSSGGVTVLYNLTK